MIAENLLVRVDHFYDDSVGINGYHFKRSICYNWELMMFLTFEVIIFLP